ncbi:hypothetical protein [Streptomyces violascens]|uniref:hypothetical protein n=1 Tax=Streptomyces violascens TaxID=67381 RepID=UPI0036A1A9C2
MTSSTCNGEPASAAADANSPAWAVRAAAGRRLAVAAETPEAADVLHRLLLDERDTGVVQATAEALLARRDVAGLRVVLKALSRAEEFEVADQLAAEVHCDPRRLSGEPGAEEFVQQLRALATDTDEGVREEARRLLPRLPSAY